MGWTDGLGGALVGGIAGLAGAGINNATSISMAQRNQRFQRDMSNTAHQREVKDLKKAGLNPVLSALGNGASTPSASGTASTSDLAGSIMSGLQYKNEKQRVKNETDTTKQNIKESIQRTATSAKEGELLQKQIDRMEAETPALQAEAQNRKEYLESTIGSALHKFGMGAQDLAVPITAIGGIGKAIIMAKGAKAISSAVKERKSRPEADLSFETRQKWGNKYDWRLAKPININY